MKDLSASRVLIVDDAKTNIDILVQALRDEYKLSVAVDGAAALRSIEKSPPDLVLLDIVMASGGGAPKPVFPSATRAYPLRVRA